LITLGTGTAGLPLGPLIVNNGPCVKQAILLGYYGLSSSIYGMIGAFVAVFAMMI
jgi:hypothetical protein